MNALPIISLLVIASLSAGCRIPPEDVKVPRHDQGAYYGHIARGSALDTNSLIRVIVNGEVHNPGPVQLASGSTILDAIKQAGGFTDFASARRIQIWRAGSHTSFKLRREMMGVGFRNHYRVWYMPSPRDEASERAKPNDKAARVDAVLEPDDILYVARSL